MRRSKRYSPVLMLAAALMACEGCVTAPTVGDPTTATGSCPAARSRTVLVDATHDGGAWWYPQADVYDSASGHQGQGLAEYLRGQGYRVTELGRGAALPTDSMRTYATIIRAGYYSDALHPDYSVADIAAYKAYLDCQRTLVLLGAYLRDGLHDPLAESIGIPLTGMISGTITKFTASELTRGVISVPFTAGSFLRSESNAAIQVLGRLQTGEGVMGVLGKGNAKVFFIGDAIDIEGLPQPLVQNLVAWGFR